MSLRLLQKLPNLDIYYDYGNEWIYADWHGELSLGSVIEGGQAILAQVVSEQCRKLLNDNFRVTNLQMEAHEWRAMDVLSRLRQAGLRYVAWVYSEEANGKLASYLPVSNQYQPITLTFSKVEVAITWLRTV